MPLLKKGTQLYSIIHCKCPRCQGTDLFIDNNPYHVGKLLDMPDRCPACGQDFQIEPGFYLGAMWVSYPVVVFLLIVFILVAHFLLGMHMVGSFVYSTLLLVLMSPILIRYSRVVYLHIFA